MLKSLVLILVCASTMLCPPVKADQKDDEIAALKEQVKQLRSENQAQRMLMAQSGASARQDTSQPSGAETPAKVRQAAPSQQQAEQSYWVTTSSSKRHNSGCRYYKNSKGRVCTKDEGIACKICGG